MFIFFSYFAIGLLTNQRFTDRANAQFSRIVELYDGLLVEIIGGIRGFIKDLESLIQSNLYSKCLPFFQKLETFQMFGLSSEVSVSAQMLRLRDHFTERITEYCKDANMSNSTEIFNSTIKEVLAVMSLTAFKNFIDMEKLRAMQESLISRVGNVCDEITSEFQRLCEVNDTRLFQKVKSSASAIDLFRKEKIVNEGTAEQYRSLANAVRSALKGFRKQASKKINEAIRHNDNTNGVDEREERSQDGLDNLPLDKSLMNVPKCHNLKVLLLLIQDASTLQGELKCVYKGEFNEVTQEMKTVVNDLSCQLANGEGGVNLTYRDRIKLTLYSDNRRKVLQLSETVDDDTTKILGDLPDLFRAFLQKCDYVIAEAATEGII